jgi:hypothetical protein
MRHCAPELGWLSLVNVTKTPPRGVALECAGKPRAGALGLKLALAVTAISLRACSSCSECNPFARYLKRTSQRVGWVCPLSVPHSPLTGYKNLQLAASSGRTLKLNSPRYFRRIVVPTLPLPTTGNISFLFINCPPSPPSLYSP